MELTITLDQVLSNIPTLLSIIGSIVIAIVGTWLKLRNIDIGEKTTAPTYQANQIETLMKQIELFSDELTKARNQIQEMHDHNIELMEQLRIANQKINDLELLLQKHH